MLQHVVLFSFPTDLSDDDWAEMQAMVRSWPDEIGGIDRVPVAPLSIAKTGDVNWFDRA